MASARGLTRGSTRVPTIVGFVYDGRKDKTGRWCPTAMDTAPRLIREDHVSSDRGAIWKVYFKLYYRTSRFTTRLEGTAPSHPHAAQSKESQPKKVQTAVTFSCGQEHGSHLRCVLHLADGELNLSATSFADTDQLQPWPGARAGIPNVQLSGGSIQEILVKPYEVRSSLSVAHLEHRKSREAGERVAAAVVGQQARDGSSGSGHPPGDHALLQSKKT
ncbi:hypothetical protein GWK47_009122 [Chionoecetes opilio]|uniref:Uncharacterized protein n=1 Tax=Chionoecetes opilio TaxID=41210 RepID=A0A8J5CNT1_CHIOP|nr:hypothetical protein GWK47_009122 [Chionoecetes opilio]